MDSPSNFLVQTLSVKNSAKFGNLFQLLTDYNFQSNTGIPDNLKCVKCRRIVIDACQVPCGCRFCRICIEELISGGEIICPGRTDDCIFEMLSDFQLDFNGNKKISKLVVQCPESLCIVECQLTDMDEHLKVCTRKTVKCPFYDFGCEKMIRSVQIDEHLKLEGSVHSSFLASSVSSIHETTSALQRTVETQQMEIEHLKLDEENNKNEIGILKKLLASKSVSSEDVRIMPVKLE